MKAEVLHGDKTDVNSEFKREAVRLSESTALASEQTRSCLAPPRPHGRTAAASERNSRFGLPTSKRYLNRHPFWCVVQVTA